jgi:hypothetical protein
MGGPDPPGVQVTFRRLGGLGLGLSITFKAANPCWFKLRVSFSARQRACDRKMRGISAFMQQKCCGEYTLVYLVLKSREAGRCT